MTSQYLRSTEKNPAVNLLLYLAVNNAINICLFKYKFEYPITVIKSTHKTKKITYSK